MVAQNVIANRVSGEAIQCRNFLDCFVGYTSSQPTPSRVPCELARNGRGAKEEGVANDGGNGRSDRNADSEYICRKVIIKTSRSDTPDS